MPDTFATDAIARREIELAAESRMDIETSLGYIPVDVSAAKAGYDVESQIPLGKRDASGASLRFIEVKGRAAGATTVTVSKNDILTAFNKQDEYILAIVELDLSAACLPNRQGHAGGTQTKTIYLKRPFREHPNFAVTSVNYNITELVNGSEVLLQ